MEYKRVRDSAGTSRRHYKRICEGCGKIDWVLTTRLKSRCPNCKSHSRTKESYSKAAKEVWTRPGYRKKMAKVMSESLPRGADHHWWRGGKAKPRAFTPEYVEWRTKVYKRDDYTCQKCGQVGFKLNAHHIKSWTYYPEHRYDLDNGVTLCYRCHCEDHKNEGGFSQSKRT
jgi:hypothetical protein|tara:strand:+ start:725 stop:1237 length:513 start_codon:yes stop_codon:yes gene_type:complete